MLELGLDPSMEIWSLSRVWGRSDKNFVWGISRGPHGYHGFGFMAGIKHGMMNGWSRLEASCKVWQGNQPIAEEVRHPWEQILAEEAEHRQTTAYYYLAVSAFTGWSRLRMTSLPRGLSTTAPR
jgi:hypothetical protein